MARVADINTTGQEWLGKLYTGYENIMENIRHASYSQCFFSFTTKKVKFSWHKCIKLLSRLFAPRLLLYKEKLLKSKQIFIKKRLLTNVLSIDFRNGA